MSAALIVSLLVTEVVCARDDGEIKTKILSATFFMMGVSTFCMSTFGLRFGLNCVNLSISFLNRLFINCDFEGCVCLRLQNTELKIKTNT